MRKEFVTALLSVCVPDEKFVFLSGDLGFLALEPVKEKLGKRFINAGVSEQNMISVAAGLAAKGLKPWVYSIAPFAVLRPYEQIRNDVCLHKLGVKIVGNGGGYGYGIMGSTHHALEDVGAMRLLPHMTAYVPVFGEDVREAVAAMHADPNPGYLRLNLGIKATPGREPFAGWRRIARGNRGVAIAMGPVASGLLDDNGGSSRDLDVVVAGKLPLEPLPQWLLDRVEATGTLVLLEEHVGAGGLGEAVAGEILGRVSRPLRCLRLYAKGYPSGRYGSQRWHQEENSLAGVPLTTRLDGFLEGAPLG